MYYKLCKICKQPKKRNNIYRYLTPKMIVELRPWDLVNVDLIGTYSNSKRQQQPGGATTNNDVSLT